MDKESEMLDQFDDIDTKEIDLPETVFIRDIESRVFQAITIKCLAEIEGISLLEGNIFDNLLGREGLERIKGIHVEQDSKNHSVNIKVELNVAFGVALPDKAEEIQSKLVKEVVRLTGLHVASVHVVFKNLLPDASLEKLIQNSKEQEEAAEEDELARQEIDEYAEEF